MTATQFEELLYLVAPAITKQTLIREPLPPAERLSITLRYLSTGDSMHSMSYHYLVGVSTISNVIDETCTAIWNSICKKVIPLSKTTEEWLHIAKEFEKRWDFNHCIGAIDGKHVIIEDAPNAAYGRRSDGGIFKDSKIGLKFESKKMNVPAPEPLSSGGPPLPYCYARG
ncbi:PREDICTED: uncharacterized protein LOC105458158, partial [Wasmannia auropunctata]|uniref:uncharacterized protein LOC105458158 n=1 Tax=Wasmannia auropunctata TaxID=64793 RepID=UPI0005EE059A